MERSSKPQLAGGHTASAPEYLDQLAEALRVYPKLTCAERADGDTPVLDVTGPGGGVAVVAGSIHFWWIDGNGPIGRIRHVDLVAERIATRCGAVAPPGERWRDHEGDPCARRPDSTSLAAGPPAALVTTA